MDFAHRAESDRVSRGYPAEAGREAPLLRRAVKFEYIRHPRMLGPCRYICENDIRGMPSRAVYIYAAPVRYRATRRSSNGRIQSVSHCALSFGVSI